MNNARSKTRYQEIKAMSDEELKALALEKGRKGNASADALLAQKVLYARTGKGFIGKYTGIYGSKHFCTGDRESGYK